MNKQRQKALRQMEFVNVFIGQCRRSFMLLPSAKKCMILSNLFNLTWTNGCITTIMNVHIAGGTASAKHLCKHGWTVKNWLKKNGLINYILKQKQRTDALSTKNLRRSHRRNIEANFLVDKIFIDLKQIYESQKIATCQIKY
jgi:hypothetical protein